MPDKALIPNKENQEKYSGKIKEVITDEVTCSCGNTIHYHRERFVPWSVIKDILRLVSR